MMRSSVGRYLRFSLAATCLVMALPLLTALVVYLRLDGDTRFVQAIAMGVSACLFVVSLGTWFWKKRPESADISFSELMLWGFIRRARAEEKVNASARALGLDYGGRPIRRMQMSSAERLRILRSLATALESKDPYTHGHSTRVKHLSVRTARSLGLSDQEIEDLRTAASLHDVGKIRIPTRILRKPRALTVEEKLIVQEHSSVGAWMVSGVSNRRVAMSVRHHHERWDGNGYPDGVAGKDIPLFARIIAVADSFDAMSSTRPYRQSMSRNTAIEEIRREAGTQFDPVVVNAFLETEPRRIAVPGLVVLGVALGAMRRAVQWGGRIGTAPVAETVAAAGAAAVVAASVFVPGDNREAPDSSSKQRVDIGSADPSGGGDAVAGEVVRPPENAILKDGAKKDGTEGASGRKGGPGKSGNGIARSVDPAAAPQKHKGPPPPSPESDGQEREPVTDLAVPASIPVDAQPDKGRDCIDRPAQGVGRGNGLHCG